MKDLRKNVEHHRDAINTLLSVVGVAEAFNDDEEFFEFINKSENSCSRFVFIIGQKTRGESTIMALSRLFDASQRNRICLIKTVDQVIKSKNILIKQAENWPIKEDVDTVIQKINKLEIFYREFKEKESILFSKIKRLKSFRDSFLAHFLENEKAKRIIFDEVNYLVRKAVQVISILHFCVLESEDKFKFPYKDSYKNTKKYIEKLKKVL